MKNRSTEKRKIGHDKLLHVVIFTIAMTSFTLQGLNAQAAGAQPADYRVMHGFSQFDEVWQFAATFNMRPPRRLRMNRLELAVGAITTPTESRPFVSFGPVWRLPIDSSALFVELGFSPTLLGGSAFNGQDLGGNFHFTSAAAVGATFGSGDAFAMALRIQHISNGGLASTNPGMDMIGLNFTYNFWNR